MSGGLGTVLHVSYTIRKPLLQRSLSTPPFRRSDCVPAARCLRTRGQKCVPLAAAPRPMRVLEASLQLSDVHLFQLIQTYYFVQLVPTVSAQRASVSGCLPAHQPQVGASFCRSNFEDFTRGALSSSSVGVEVNCGQGPTQPSVLSGSTSAARLVAVVLRNCDSD